MLHKSASITSTPVSTDISRRVTIGSLAVIMGQGINILRQVLLVPLFLWAWGAQLYGEWLALYAVVAYLSILDFGMQMYVVNRLNQCYSVNRLSDYNRVLHSALVLYLSIAAVAGVSLASVTFNVPIEQWLNFKFMNHTVAALVTVLLVVQLIFAIPQGLILGLYRTFGEFPRGTMIRNLQQISIFGLTALTILLGGGVVHVAAVQLLPLAGITAFVLRDLKKRRPEIRIGIKEADWRLAVTFLGPSLLFFLIQVSGVITIQGSIIVVSVLAGSAYVAIFAVHRTLTNFIRQMVGALTNALWPELTSLEAKGDYDKLRVLHRSFVKMSFSVCVFAGIWLHFIGKDIISVWTMGRLVFDQKLFDVFLLYLMFQAPWLASSVFPAAFNRHRNLAVCYIVSAVLGIAFSLFLFRFLGITGVALGLLIADVLVCGWFVPLQTCRILDESVKKFWLEVVVRGLPVIVVVWSGAWFLQSAVSSSVTRIIIVGLTVGLLGAVCGYAFWLDKPERLQVVNAGAALLNKVGRRA